MYKNDWITEENMTEWEENYERNKNCDIQKSHFEKCYIMCKLYHDAKGIKLEDTNRIDAEANKYWESMAEQTEQAEATEQL